MDALFLSRLQFAAATMFHFLFVPLTLGLSFMVAIMETRYARTGDEVCLKMTRFWGKIFLINFVLGIVTGITLEFQFGTNWSRYSAFVGDIFGSLLAIEATAAFFLESTLIGVWIFGWKKLSRRAHAAIMWLIAGASTLSAVWILIANAWMQHPVGYVIRNGRAELESFTAVVFQKSAFLLFLHTVSAAYILSAFFVMGISAYHLLRKHQVEVFQKSFRIALVLGLIFSLGEVFEGHLHGSDLAEKQPAKLALLEAHWETSSRAPIYLLALPDEKNERNFVAILPIPGALSFLATHDFNAVIKGLKDFPPGERPPVFINFLAFKIMVALGGYFVLMALIGWIKRNRLTESPGYLKLMLYSIPLPYIASQAGWVLAEVGRQPWIVYGLMKTSDAASPIGAPQVLVSFLAFVLVYGILGALWFYLISKNAKRGHVPAEGDQDSMEHHYHGVAERG
ncbi:MAG TPA: cytochrome ubiquinol oxidase subunit I [Thermodesulfobacteriota bacterium]|nr:cytochrome ubiquinol oxidase subunit I [Thermodesulfobacteriota bacterium]